MTKPSNPSSDAVYFDGAACVKETEKAVLVTADDLDGETWIPKSQVHDDSEICGEGDEGTLAVTRWFAEKENLV